MILNEQTSVIQKFKENLKEDLYKITMKLSEKYEINKIIQKENLTNKDKTELISMLRKLPSKELISLLSENLKISNRVIDEIDISNPVVFTNKKRNRIQKNRKPTKDDKRAKVEKDVLRRVVKTIIKNDSSIKSMNALSRFLYGNNSTLKNAINLGYTMDYKNFKKLENLYGSSIPHKVQSKIYKTNKKWIFLDEDEEGNVLSKKETIKRAASYLKKEILKGDYSIYTQDHIRNVLKRGDFLKAIQSRGFGLNNILIEANLPLNRQHLKWEKFKWDESGNPRTKEQALQNAGEFLISLIEENEYDFGHLGAPTVEFLQARHGDFYSSLGHRNLRYNEVLGVVDLKINHENEKWSFLDVDDLGNILDRNQILERGSNYFYTYIFTSEFKKMHNLEYNEAPTIDLVKNWIKGTEYVGFLDALSKRRVNYNDILKFLGLQVNHDLTLWTFLNWSPEGIPRTYEEALINAGNYLKNTILTEEFRKEYDLEEDEAPARYMLQDHVIHNSFSWALSDKKISFMDVLYTLGFIPQDKELLKDIGMKFHWIAEDIFIQFTRSKGCLSFYEIQVNKKTKVPLLYEFFGKRICDNSIIVNENLRSLSIYTRNIPSHIKIIHVDYYLGRSQQYIKKKCRKGYQSKNRMLIIVPLHAKSEMEIPDRIPFKENVKILSPTIFAKFFGFDNQTKELFLNHVNLAKEAIFKEDTYQQLINHKIKSRNNLLSNINFGQKGLEYYLESKNKIKLLRYIPDKNHIYFYLKEENNNSINENE